MMGHHSFNDKAAVLIRRPHKCPSTLKSIKVPVQRKCVINGYWSLYTMGNTLRIYKVL